MTGIIMSVSSLPSELDFVLTPTKNSEQKFPLIFTPGNDWVDIYDIEI